MAIDTQELAAWVTPLREAIQQPPALARTPFYCNGIQIGDVVSSAFTQLPLAQCMQADGHSWVLEQRTQPLPGWYLQSTNATLALNALAHVLRAQGMCGPWRDEQLDVFPLQAECTDVARVASVERGAVRPLGIATQAVHLIGHTAHGTLWIQRRADNKATYPGCWDTLMGGMVSGGDTLLSALARETMEEAGLAIDGLKDCCYGGWVDFACPAHDAAPEVGYMRERIHWYSAAVPDALQPCNLDGEVQQFACVTPDECWHLMQEGRFTPEAALILAAYFER